MNDPHLAIDQAQAPDDPESATTVLQNRRFLALWLATQNRTAPLADALLLGTVLIGTAFLMSSSRSNAASRSRHGRVQNSGSERSISSSVRSPGVVVMARDHS